MAAVCPAAPTRRTGRAGEDALQGVVKAQDIADRVKSQEIADT
jgi:hypothetical protein